MRVLITGGAGFIGSQIARAYLEDGHEVAILDNLSTGSKRFLPRGADFHPANIADADAVERACREFRPEVVLHYAAQLDVRRSLEDPAEDARVNILGGLNVLIAAARHGAHRFLFASSGGAIYGDTSRLPADERTEPRPLSPYGLTKLTFEGYLRIWEQTHGIVPVILRYANVYGPRQNAHGEAGVMAIFSRRLLENEPCTIYGDGTSTRDYVFVGDVVEANRLALTRGDGETLNIGSGAQTTVREVFDVLRDAAGEMTGRRLRSEPTFAPARAGEVYRSCLDASHARRTLGWSPRTGFQEGARQTLLAIQGETG